MAYLVVLVALVYLTGALCVNGWREWEDATLPAPSLSDDCIQEGFWRFGIFRDNCNTEKNDYGDWQEDGNDSLVLEPIVDSSRSSNGSNSPVTESVSKLDNAVGSVTAADAERVMITADEVHQSAGAVVQTTGKPSIPSTSSSSSSSSSTSMINTDRLRYIRRANQVWLYGAPVLIVGGTVGNVLSIIVMLRKRIRHTTTSLYLIVLALADTGVLYTGLLRYWIKALNGHDVRLVSSVTCKLHVFIVYAVQQFDSWVLVAVTMERLVAVFWPHRAHDIFTKPFASIGLVIITLLIVSINMHFFYTHELVTFVQDGLKKKACTTVYKTHWLYMKNIWPWIDFATFSLMPFLLIALSNVAIVMRLLYSSYMRQHHLQANGGNSGLKMTSMTAILLTISLVFFITTAPISIYLITYHNSYRTADRDTKEWFTLVWAVINIIMYCNNAVNFLLYCISGPRFRREMVALFSRRNTVHPGNTVSFELAHT